MNDLMMLLGDNALLIAGLVMGALMLGLGKIAAKTENKIDDQVVDRIKENKDSLVVRLADLIRSKLKK